MSYRVAIVVDPNFREKLSALADRVHVWVCSTTENRRHAEEYWRSAPEYSLDRGITTFTVSESQKPEEMLLGILSVVDLHHGEYSHTPPWDILEVYGSPLTPSIRSALVEFGIGEFSVIPGGFQCSRHVESTAEETSDG